MINDIDYCDDRGYTAGCRHSREYSCGQENYRLHSRRQSYVCESPHESRRKLSRSRRCSDLRNEGQNRDYNHEDHECIWKRRFMKSNAPRHGSSGTEDDLQGITVILHFGNREDVVVKTDLRRGETVDFDV